MTASAPAELEARAEAYCRALLVKYVKAGATFVSSLDEQARDILVGVMMEAYCEGALDALREVCPAVGDVDVVRR